MSALPTGDVLDKLKGLVRDRTETWAMLAAMLLFAGEIVHILGWRTNIKDYENALSWLIGALVATLVTFVAGEVMQKPKRERRPPAAKPEEPKP